MAFYLTYGQQPLYTSNQNTYYLHGLAMAGRGDLHADWLAGTSDPFPLFSLIVEWTAGVSEGLFHLYQFGICAVYWIALVTIGKRCGALTPSRSAFFLFVGFLLLLHSPSLHLRDFLFEGVAGQAVLTGYFQPSVFGVFLLASVALFLKGRPYAAVASAAVAATFHASYLLSSSLLVGCYAWLSWFLHRAPRRSIGLVAVGFLLLAPTALYAATAFRPTSAIEAQTAQAILVNVRMPHHAKVGDWFGGTTLLRILLVLLAMRLTSSVEARWILAWLLGGIAALTALQMISGSDRLALLFPWRTSVIVGPIAGTIFLAAVAGRVARRPVPSRLSVRSSALLAGALILAGCGAGLAYTYRQVQQRAASSETPVMTHVAKMAGASQLYLIPVEMERFRLETGVPVLVDRKSHPYLDVEVLEWYRRLHLAESFYGSEGAAACRILGHLREGYPLTHVVWPRRRPWPECGAVASVYHDSAFSVFRLSSPASRTTRSEAARRPE